MIAARSRGQSGFTLLELLIAATLSVVLTLITAHFWSYFSRQLTDLNARARVAQELRLAVNSIRRDMGPAVGATAVDTDQMLLCLDPDTLVTYALVGGQLVRQDASAGTVVVVADHVAAFTAQDLTESLRQMTITVTRDDISRQVTLLWSKP
jgi:prepilin-type N-terminal cleavage/methylation domain-containing protein